MIRQGIKRLELMILMKVSDDIADKWDQHKQHVDDDDRVDNGFWDAGDHDHKDQTDKEHGRADFTGKKSAFEHFAFAEIDPTGNQLETLFYDKQNNKVPNKAIFYRQTEDQGELRCFVR